MYFNIRRRSTGKIVESGFKTREKAKPQRDALNKKYYDSKDLPVPLNNREFYVTRSHQHRFGKSK
jgi:hypothetical protein